MADFKYIIQAELRLKQGALKQLISDVGEMDRVIKSHYDKNGGGVRVPLSVDKDISKLQRDVKKVVEGYNNGQAPSIRIKVAPDESSIAKLQARIEEVKKQINSLSNDKDISINTSLKVGNKEKENIQRQVGETKATVVVGLRLNPDDIKKIQRQIEDVRAEVTAQINATADNDFGRRLGGQDRRANNPANTGHGHHHHNNPTTSTGSSSRNTRLSISNRPDSADRFIAQRREIQQELKTIADVKKEYDEELKGITDLEKYQRTLNDRIDKINKNKSKGLSKVLINDDFSNGKSYTSSDKFDSTIEEYKDKIAKAGMLATLQKQYDAKRYELNEIERKATYSGKNATRIPAQHPLAQLNAQNDAQAKLEEQKRNASKKARESYLKQKRARDLKAQKEIERSQKNYVSDQDVAEKLAYEQLNRDGRINNPTVAFNNAKTESKYRNNRVMYANNAFAPAWNEYHERLGYISDKAKAQIEAEKEHRVRQANAPKYYEGYVNAVQKRNDIASKLEETKNLVDGKEYDAYSRVTKTGADKRAQYSPVELAVITDQINKLSRQLQDANKEVDSLRTKAQLEMNKLNSQSKIGQNYSNNRFNSIGNTQAEHESMVREWKAEQERIAQESLEKQWSTPNTFSQLPANGKVAKLISRNDAKQQKLNDRDTQRVVNLGQAKSDFDSGIRRFGPQGIYSGRDYEAMLSNPNISYEDSMKIMKEQLHPFNQRLAISGQSNFQKQYGISFKDEDGNIRQVRTLTYQYTKLGEVIEKGDKGFSNMMEHITSRVGIYSVLEGALAGVSIAIEKSITDMAQFDAQLADVLMTTQQLNSSAGKLQQFYSTVGGTSSMESQVQNDTFKNAETYGVSGLDTVMPIEQQVIARHNLVAGSNGQYDASKKDDIVQKIMQFSAISTGGNEDPQTTNELTQDMLSLYQAYYNPSNPNQDQSKMNGLFNFMTGMKTRGVNTTAISNAMAELAPDTITAGIDSKQVMASLGAYNLSDASATGDDIQTIGRTFFGSLRHAGSNGNIKSALQMMGLDLNTKDMSASDLMKYIFKNYGNLTDPKKEMFAQAFSGTSGQSKAMTPKMVKFLDASQNPDFKYFTQGMDTTNAMQNAWGPFSSKLKTQFDGLVEKLQEFVQLIGRLGVLDGLGVLVKTFSSLLSVVNSVLRGVQALSDVFSNNHWANIPKLTLQILALSTALKGLRAFSNNAKWGGAVGDYMAGKFGGRTFGVKRNNAPGTWGNAESVGSAMAQTAPIITTAPAQQAEKEITSTVESATTKINPSAMNVIEKSVVAQSADSMLENVITFSTADMLANKFRTNPATQRLMTDINGTASAGVSSALSNAIPQSYKDAKQAVIDATVTKESQSAMGKTGSAIGSFFNDTFMMSSIKRNGGVGAVAGNIAETATSKTGSIISAVAKGFGDMLPALRGFLLLLTQLTVIGGALTIAFLGTKALIDEMNKEHSAQVTQQAKNVLKLQTSNRKDPSVGKKFDTQINNMIDYKKGNQSQLAENPLWQKYGVNTPQQSKGEANSTYLQDKFNVKYHRTFGGKNDYVTYMDGQKNPYTAHVNNPAEMKTMNDFFKNGGISDVQKIAQAWQDSTTYLTGYNEELAKVSFLQQGINENMQNMATQQKAIQAQFAGVDSTSSDNAQASAIKQAIDASKNQMNEMQGHVSDLKTNRDKAQSSLDSATHDALYGNKSKGLKAVGGINQSDINKATDQMAYAMQNPTVQNPDSVLSQYDGIDLNTSNGMKEARKQGFVNKKGKVVDQQGLDEYNNKMSAMQDILQIFQTLFTFQNNYTQGNDQLSQAQQQDSQNKQEYKQLQAQSMIASTGISTLSASLSKLNSVAQATSAMVTIMANPLQNGNNSAQINALHTSAQVSMTQMANLQTQSGSLQSSMDSISKNNPNQDFSLNQLYNPSGDVTAEQLAYKSMYETKQQVDTSIASQSQNMYQMYSQMRDLVLSSNEYADVWQRIQDTIQNIKDDMKNLHDTQFALASVNQNAMLQATFTGQDVSQVRQQQLTSLRDSSAQLMQQATTNMYSVNSDNSQYQSAMDYITSQMGAEFTSAMIDPLKSIISNETNTNNAFAGSVNSFSKAVSQFQSAVGAINNTSTSSSNNYSPTDINGQPNTNGYGIPGFSSSGGKMTEEQYLQSMGLRPGTSEYMNAKKQFDSMSSSDQQSTLGTGGGNQQYVDAINKTFQGTNLQGMGQAYVDAGAQYGIDPRLMASITMQETGGSSHALNSLNNVGGIEGSNGLASFNTKTDSVNDLARILKSYYFDQGKNTIPEIQAKYAPVGAGNDPTGLNNNWQKGVASYYSAMTGLSSSQLLGGQAISSSNGSGVVGSPSSNNSSGSGNGATTTANVHLRSTPSSSGKILKTLPTGSTYQTYGEQNGWVNVGSGWVDSQYMKGNFNSHNSSSPSSSNTANGGVQGMMNWLSSVKGNTKDMSYVWGGAHQTESWAQFLSKAVADCSGLVEQVYKQFAGVNLGTTTAQGIYSDNNGGTKVSSQSQLQAGDLVFFGSSTGHITHTGIYAGNGQDYAIDNTGKPVSLDSMSAQKDYVGGKHFNIASSGAVNSSSASSGQSDTIIATAMSEIQYILGYATDYMHTMNSIDMPKAQVNGNITDVLGTSGVTARYDRIVQARQDINGQMISNVDQMNQAVQTRNMLQGEVNTSSGSQKTTYQNELDATNLLITALQSNTKSLQSLDATYASWQQNDPRLNLANANGYIHEGLNSLNAMQGQGTQYSVDYFRKASEIGTMNSQYMTAQKQTDAVQGVFDNYGEQAMQLSFLKGSSDQNSVNVVMNQIGNMNDVFKTLATGTQQWWSTLNEVAQVQQKLHDLEQQRLQDAQTEFNLTGQGLQGYVSQKAYTQSKQYSQDASNVKAGIAQYKSGTTTGGYSLSTGTYLGSGGASKVVDYLKNNYGVTGTLNDLGVTQKQVSTVTSKGGVSLYKNSNGSGYVKQLKQGGQYTVYGEKNGFYNVGAGWVPASSMTKVSDSYRVSTDSTLSSSAVNSMGKDLKSKGLAGVTYSSGGNSSTQDFNQQLATLQTIADSHNNMIQQMDSYKQAVTDAFTAGALSVDQYMSKLNQLRDVQTELKQSATNMISNIQGGFQSAISQAMSNGMQGELNSPLSFMNSIKSTLSDSISNQLTSVLLNNTGLQDVMNKMTSSITQAATSGSPQDMVNMFQNNDFGKQINDTLNTIAPYIQQIVGSTQGIFTILKDQTFNAPSGFKVDRYMNEIANSMGYQGIKTMNPNVNGVGSPIVNTPSGSGSVTPTSSTDSTTGITTVTNQQNGPQAPITTTAPSQTPTGVPTTVSGTGATSTGNPNGTTGSTISAPSTSGLTALPSSSPPKSTSQPVAKPAPAPVPSTKTVKVHSVGGVWLHKTPDTNTASRVKLLPNGTSWKSYGEKNGMQNLGSGYASAQYVYHTGGIAGISNFASSQGLKPNELQAILQKEESVFQPRQLTALLQNAMQLGAVKSGAMIYDGSPSRTLASQLQDALHSPTVFQPRQMDNLASDVAHSGAIKNNSDSGMNLTINVNIEGGGNYDQKGIEAVVETAVQEAMSAFKKNTKMNNLTWKGTSY